MKSLQTNTRMTFRNFRFPCQRRTFSILFYIKCRCYFCIATKRLLLSFLCMLLLYRINILASVPSLQVTRRVSTVVLFCHALPIRKCHQPDSIYAPSANVLPSTVIAVTNKTSWVYLFLFLTKRVFCIA